MSKISVLFVCLGNICRSPVAEAIFTDIVRRNNTEAKFKIDSAGTCANHIGENADPRSRASAKGRGIDITSIARQFIQDDFNNFDHIVVMDDSNFDNVMALSNNSNIKKVSKLTDYSSSKFSEFDKVPDPYFGGERGFELVLDLVQDCCENFFKRISN